jgi:hypothetical protein
VVLVSVAAVDAGQQAAAEKAKRHSIVVRFAEADVFFEAEA